MRNSQIELLERICFTTDEAKAYIIKMVEEESRHDVATSSAKLNNI